ncbi:MAG: DddA-like double-stranded DNA deaminase toxin [Geminicoccaceae bacterium]
MSGADPIFIKSGIDGGPWGGTQRGGIPRLAGWAFTRGGPSQGNIGTHVEGHAAAIMWQIDCNKAVLVVDRPMCAICSQNLPRALPPRSRLDVISEEEDRTVIWSSHYS